MIEVPKRTNFAICLLYCVMCQCLPLRQSKALNEISRWTDYQKELSHSYILSRTFLYFVLPDWTFNPKIFKRAFPITLKSFHVKN